MTTACLEDLGTACLSRVLELLGDLERHVGGVEQDLSGTPIGWGW
jgi:hypothetical protein